MNTRNKNKLRALMLVLKSRKYVVDVISFEGDIISIKIKRFNILYFSKSSLQNFTHVLI